MRDTERVKERNKKENEKKKNGKRKEGEKERDKNIYRVKGKEREKGKRHTREA